MNPARSATADGPALVGRLFQDLLPAPLAATICPAAASAAGSSCARFSEVSRRHDNDATEVSVRREWDGLSCTGRLGGSAVKYRLRRSFFLQGYRSMAHTS